MYTLFLFSHPWISGMVALVAVAAVGWAGILIAAMRDGARREEKEGSCEGPIRNPRHDYF